MMTASIAAMFLTASMTYNLPPGLLSALCFVESGHKPNVVNPDDRGGPSRGICQVQERTARYMGFRGTIRQLMEPKVNIRLAAKYLRFQLDRYHGDVVKALAAYNAGIYRRDSDGMPKNKFYVLKVLRAVRERQ